MDLLSLDVDDCAHVPRITDTVYHIFEKYNFYYIPEYSVDKLNTMISVHHDSAIIKRYRVKDFMNVSYEWMKYKDKLFEYGLWYNDFWWLVTEIDKDGVLSPINCFENQFFHPGGKRVRASVYLGKKNIKAILQTKDTYKNYKKIETLEELCSIYGNDCSFDPRKDNDLLQISWHGATHRRDKNGHDDWWSVAETIRKEYDFNFSDLAMQHGIDVVNPWFVHTVKNDVYKINFVNKSNSPFRIELLDKNLHSKDFWRLVFHFDYRYKTKICKSGKIVLHNDLSNQNLILENASLLNTLNRRKQSGFVWRKK